MRRSVEFHLVRTAARVHEPIRNFNDIVNFSLSRLQPFCVRIQAATIASRFQLQSNQTIVMSTVMKMDV
jgi:hypothetical protein